MERTCTEINNQTSSKKGPITEKQVSTISPCKKDIILCTIPEQPNIWTTDMGNNDTKRRCTET